MKSINSHLAPLPKIRKFDGHDWYQTKISERNLPHWELRGSTYFITFRVISKLGKPFSNEHLAKILLSELERQHNLTYELYAFVIMPDHLHLIIKPLPGQKLALIMQKLKGSSSYKINKFLGRSGSFWQKESFDHLIRNQAGLRDKWDYIRLNPEKAGLVNSEEDYPFSSFSENYERQTKVSRTCSG